MESIIVIQDDILTLYTIESDLDKKQKVNEVAKKIE